MAEPATPAIATLLAQAAVVPIITAFGVPLGLRADVLLAAFAGALAAMALLNTVPSSGDTLLDLLKTSLTRVGVAAGCAAFGGYAAPLVALMISMPDTVILGVAFILGAGARRILPLLIDRFGRSDGK